MKFELEYLTKQEISPTKNPSPSCPPSSKLDALPHLGEVLREAGGGGSTCRARDHLVSNHALLAAF